MRNKGSVRGYLIAGVIFISSVLPGCGSGIGLNIGEHKIGFGESYRKDWKELPAMRADISTTFYEDRTVTSYKDGTITTEYILGVSPLENRLALSK